MPPIKKLEDAFLSHLLENQLAEKDTALLNTNIDTASLSTILQKLESTSNALQQQLFEQVYTNYDIFSSSYNASQKLHSQVMEIFDNVAGTEQDISGTQSSISAIANEYRLALAASQRNQAKIEILERLEEILGIMNEIDNELTHSSHVKATEHVNQLTHILKDWNDVDARVKELISKRVDQLKQKLVNNLQDGIRVAIQYNPNSMRVLETFKSPNEGNVMLHISDLFSCFHELGLLPGEMMTVQHQIIKNIIQPYFKYPDSHLQIDHVDIDSLGSGGVLQVIANHNDSHQSIQQEDEEEKRKLEPVKAIQAINSILSYFHKYLFAHQNKNNINIVFGNILLPELEELMISKAISPAIPSTQSSLFHFDKVAHAASQFQQDCINTYHFQSPDTESSSVIATYVKNVDKHYAKKRCERILQDGRKVMMRRLYDAEPATLEQDGHLHHFKTTQTPQILSVLVSDTLQEAEGLFNTQHPVSATALSKGIKDLLDMYRAIMPSYHRPQFAANPANALVFRNDCLWLSNQLLLLLSHSTTAINHFNSLETDLRQSSHRLVELGKAWHEFAMSQRVQTIQSHLDHLDGFTNMTDGEKFQQDCDHTIATVIDLVSSFASETQPVVDEILYLDMLGRITDSILSRLIHDIEDLSDIGAQESHVIARALNSLAQLVGVFDLPGEGRDATESVVAELVPTWQKFWLVKDILEMNMRDIMEAFRRGDLIMFDKVELVGLLEALFADSGLRQANIVEIRTGHQTYSGTESSHSNSRVMSPALSRSVSALGSPIVSSENDTRAISVPQPIVSKFGLEYTPDDDMDTAEGGWGDENDDDLFAQESLSLEENPNTTLYESKQHTTHSPPSLKPSPFAVMEEDQEEAAGGGWRDADEDIFDHEPVLLAASINKEKSINNPLSQQQGHGEDQSNHHLDKVKDESNTTAGIDGMKEENPSHSLSSSALDIQEMEQEEGEGWGWDDEDEDLFKAHDK